MNKRNLSFSKTMFNGAFIFNPVLTQAIGICTIAAIGTTLKLSLIFSLLLGLLLIIMELISSLILRKLSRWLRISAYMIISLLLLLPVMLYMDKNFSELSAAMGIFLPLLAVNSIIVIRCEIFAVKNNLRNSFLDAFASAVGFAAVSIITGTARELMAYGTVLGKQVSHLPVLSGIALPFGGLITIGFLAALHKWFIQKKFPRYPTNTFNLRTAFDTPTFRNEGINVTDGTLSFLRDPVHADEDDEVSEKYSEAEKMAARRLFMTTEDEESETSLDDIIRVIPRSNNRALPKADEKKEGEE